MYTTLSDRYWCQPFPKVHVLDPFPNYMYLSTYSRSLWLPVLDPPVPPLSPPKVHVPGPTPAQTLSKATQSTCTWSNPIVTSSSLRQVHVSVRQVHVPGWTPPSKSSQSTCKRPFPELHVLDPFPKYMYTTLSQRAGTWCCRLGLDSFESKLFYLGP